MVKRIDDPKRDPVIVAAKRTAIGKAPRGSFSSTRPEDLAAMVIQGLLKEAPQIDPKMIDDVFIGCAMPEGQQGLNMGRRIVLRAGLPVEVPAETINRFCSSGLQSIAHAAQGIMSGMIEIAIAGGVESMSMIPMRGIRMAPNPTLVEEYPDAYVNMGLTAENVADEYKVSREDQDAFSANSHKKAAAAQASDRFQDEILPIDVEVITVDGTKKFTHQKDEGIRPTTTAEALSKLRPVFKEGGTVTAGNASQLSDGAAGVIIMSHAKAEELGLEPIARFIGFSVGGVRPEVMGIGPIVAIPKVLKQTELALDEIDLIELNEAFASQALAVTRELDLNSEIVNVNGGAIALGHPLGCTGTKLSVQLLHEMQRRNSKFGMVSMCIGGGMGAAGIFENLK